MAIQPQGPICTSGICYDISRYLKESMSPNHAKLDPCSKWDEYVCGGYRLKNTVPSNRRQVTRLTTLSDQVDEILFDILHSDYQNVATITLDNNTTDRLDAEAIKKADESNFNLLKGYYESCIHDEEVQNIGSASVRRLYDRIFNFSIGLPIPTDRGWNGTTSNEISIIGEAIRRMGSLDIPAFIQYGPYQSLLKPNETALMLSLHKSRGLPAMSQYRNKNIRDEYTRILTKFMKETYGPHLGEERNLEVVAGSIIDLEYEIGHIFPKPEEYRDIHKTGNLRALNWEQLASTMSKIPIREILEAHFTDGISPPSTVEVLLPKKLSALGRVIHLVPATTILAYLHWHVFLETLDLWRLPLADDWKKFINKLNGQKIEPDLPEICLGRVKQHLGPVLDTFYVKSKFSKEGKLVAGAIAGDIKTNYVKLLNDTPWFTQETKYKVLEKANSIGYLVGYNDQMSNAENTVKLSHYYAGAPINRHRYNMTTNKGHTDDYLDFQAWKFNKTLQTVSTQADLDALLLGATDVNAYYSPTQNRLVLPAALLQFPLFHPSLPSLVNYASFGSIVGHEFSHAFDHQGRGFGVDGWIAPNDWQIQDMDQFSKRNRCFAKKYNKIKIKGPKGTEYKIEGKRVVSEAIADSVGSDLAFTAWKSEEDSHTGESLPGFDHLTKDQLFWILRSSWFCSVEKTSNIIEQVHSDDHPPFMVRTWAPLKHSNSWHQSFGCEIDKGNICRMFGPKS